MGRCGGYAKTVSTVVPGVEGRDPASFAGTPGVDERLQPGTAGLPGRVAMDTRRLTLFLLLLPLG